MVYTYYLTNKILFIAENSKLKTDSTCGWITHGRSCTPTSEVNLAKSCEAVITRPMVHSNHRILCSAPWTTPVRTPSVGCGCDWKDMWKVPSMIEGARIWLSPVTCRDHWPTWYREFGPILGNPHYYLFPRMLLLNQRYEPIAQSCSASVKTQTARYAPSRDRSCHWTH